MFRPILAFKGFAALLAAASLAWTQSQAAWVEGFAVDPEGKPLAGATAALRKAGQSTSTAGDGAFRLDPGSTALLPRSDAAQPAAGRREPPRGIDALGRAGRADRPAPWMWSVFLFPGGSPLPKTAAAIDTLTLKADGFALKTVVLDGYGKSLGRIELAREPAPGDSVLYRAGSLEVRQNGSIISLRGPAYTVRIDLSQGMYHVQAGGKPLIAQAFSDVILEDKRRLQGPGYASHLSGRAYLEAVHDGFGDGLKAVVEHRGDGLPVLRERFFLYQEKPYFLVECEAGAAVAGQSIASNFMSPLSVAPGPGAGLDLGAGASARVLSLPWDNDKYLRHAVKGSGDAREGYGAAAVFDNASRQGLVIGAVTHDLWKTGLRFKGISGSKVAQAAVYGGAATPDTRDTEPHGMVRGASVVSPRILIGFYADWRAGMEDFGRACALVAPPMAWDKGVPFGWNSWAAVGSALAMEPIAAASDFLKADLTARNAGFGGEVYVNLDSFWDNLNEASLRDAVKRIHANGQKAGIYWSPFTYWGTTPYHEGLPVEGADGKYLYRETYLRNAKGEPVPVPDGGVAMDPTHPGTLARIDWQLQRFVDWGFDFVKLDFVNYGAIEGAHFDKGVATGTAAYNLGMQRIRARLDPARIGRPFFISLSIAPLFPHQYGHARRISCDAFGHIGATEYLLSALTGGWWQNRSLFPFNDPDAAVLSKSFNETATSEAEAGSRLNASVITGTVMLMGDDLRDSTARDRYRRLLLDPEINALAARGRSFRPVESDTGEGAASLFVLDDRERGDFHAAVFNYASTPQARTLSPGRLGLPAGGNYRLYDLRSKTYANLGAGATVTLQAAESRIYRIVAGGH